MSFCLFVCFEGVIKLYRMSLSRSLILPSPKSHRVDEWALITEQKTLEERKARQYQHLLAQQKRRRMKEHLEAQIEQKQKKEEEEKEYQKRYASEAIRRAEEVQMLEKMRKRQTNERRKQVQIENKNLFSGIVDSKVREQYENTKSGYSMDIGYSSQQERRRQAELAKRHMIDELDRQIQEKERYKTSLRQKEKFEDKLNFSVQDESQERRKDQRRHGYNQYPTVQEHYQHLVERQYRKDRLFDYSRIQLQAQRKMQEEILKANQKDEEKKLGNLRMKQILDHQVMIQKRKKQEEDRVNPEELSYGLFGKMLNNRSQIGQNRQQQYYMELQKQIEEKERLKQAEKYMTEEQYKINLNQLNRAVQGKFADNTYIDRSIHALSEPHNVNVILFDSKVERPDAEMIKPTLEALKNRRRERTNSPPQEHMYKY